MSYPDIGPNFLEDLLSRKEFYQYKIDPLRNFRDPSDAPHDPLTGKHLKIHSHQLFDRNFMSPYTPYKRLLLMHATGCHAAGTPIMMSDGRIKRVEDVQVGDLLMGDNCLDDRHNATQMRTYKSNPRQVLELRRGRDLMYRVRPKSYPSFVCNSDHILTVLSPHNGIIDITISQLLKHDIGQYRLINSGILDSVVIPISSVGDGYTCSSLSYQDRLNIVSTLDWRNMLVLSSTSDNTQWDFTKVGNHATSPFAQAGINPVLDVNISNDNITLGVYKNLCRSLGLRVSTYYSGDNARIVAHTGGLTMQAWAAEHSQAPAIDYIEFSIEKVDVDNYYGFVLDGNHRYVMGNYIVTHNTGKSLAAVTIAQKFISVYTKMYQSLALKMPPGRRNNELNRATPTVFVLGFGSTKKAFIKEMLKYPEFGFITMAEKDELLKRQKIAEAGLPDDIRQLKEYYSGLKKRVTNKARGGFYEFYGYQEFVNRLFTPASNDSVKLTDIETMVNQRRRAGENITSEEIILQYINDGKIQVNQLLLNRFKNSLLICDEIHNTYNMNMKNNYGVAIQFVLDSTPTLRALFMSATPINNSPTEIVDIMNYLIPVNSEQVDKSEESNIDDKIFKRTQKLTKRDLFDASGRNLLPGKLEFIGKALIGRVSVLQDINLKYFPKRTFLGDVRRVTRDLPDVNMRSGDPIPYLKFVECPMSELHQSTLNYLVSEFNAGKLDVVNFDEDAEDITETLAIEEEIDGADEDSIADLVMDTIKDDNIKDDNIKDNNIKDNNITSTSMPLEKTLKTPLESPLETPKKMPKNPDLPEYSYHKIPTDGYTIYDIVYPNPDNPKVGLFRSVETRAKIAGAPQQWRDDNGIALKKYNNSIMITGDFLRQENISKYSTKFSTLLKEVTTIIERAKGNPKAGEKIMIYHDRVKMSGVLQIQELLRANNILDEFSTPVDSSICMCCGRSMADHRGPAADISQHEFRPARFITVHSDIPKPVMDQSLAKFNSADNANGENFNILIGSQIIKEGYDFKDIQNLIITTLPVNIPTLIQVFGRSIRKGSHINLPPEQREVKISILITTVNPKYSPTDTMSPEEYRYVDKLSDYKLIQNIEREMNRNAIDADIHRDIIMPPQLYKTYFPDSSDNTTDNTASVNNTNNITSTRKEPVNAIGNLYFEPAYRIPREYNLGELNMSTFTAYKHHEEEIKLITYIIKRLFMMQPVWTYDDLWNAVRRPPFGIEQNPKLFSEGNFIISLSNLVSSAPELLSREKSTELSETQLVERIFDQNERYIIIDGIKYKIEQLDKFYIIFPLTAMPVNPISAIHLDYATNAYNDRNPIKQIKSDNAKIIVDAETYLRPVEYQSGIKISVGNFVREYRAKLNYGTMRAQFFKQYFGPAPAGANITSADDINLYDMINLHEDFQKAIIEEAIIYSVSGVMGKQISSSDFSASDESASGFTITSKMYSIILEFYAKFDVIIYSSEVKKYKDTTKLFKDGPGNSIFSRSIPIGYMTSKTVRLLDPVGDRNRSTSSRDYMISSIMNSNVGKWIEISKVALNRFMQYHENNNIVGYFEAADDEMKFKLRKPIQIIKSKNKDIRDTRLVEKGIVCATKNKHELMHIISLLGISTSKLAKTENRIRKMCDVIRNKIMNNEIRERGNQSKIKWMYSWWDEPVQLT